MMKRLILLAAGALSCAAFGEEAPAINATANLDRQFQTIESFTASDAWSGNFIGKFFADDKKEKLAKERKVQTAILNIKKQFGKNAILKGLNYEEGATAKERNQQIGGHKA